MSESRNASPSLTRTSSPDTTPGLSNAPLPGSSPHSAPFPQSPHPTPVTATSTSRLNPDTYPSDIRSESRPEGRTDGRAPTPPNALDALAESWARNFHDDVAQYLAALSLGLRSLREPGDPPARTEKLDRLDRLAFDMQAKLYSVIDRLQNPERGGDLRTELSRIADHWAAYGTLRVHTHFRNLPRLSLPHRIHLSIVCIVKEAITNAARHASVDSVIVRASVISGSLKIAIRDRGTGFSTSSPSSRPASPLPPFSYGGHGLRGMSENARSIHASLLIRSKPNAGTLVLLQLPLPLSAPAPSAPTPTTSHPIPHPAAHRL